MVTRVVVLPDGAGLNYGYIRISSRSYAYEIHFNDTFDYLWFPWKNKKIIQNIQLKKNDSFSSDFLRVKDDIVIL